MLTQKLPTRVGAIFSFHSNLVRLVRGPPDVAVLQVRGGETHAEVHLRLVRFTALVLLVPLALRLERGVACRKEQN